MVDRSFEADLERRFADVEPMADAEVFAQRVTAAVDRGWGFRRVLIGTLGLAGGLIGLAQVLRSGLFDRAQALGGPIHALLASAASRLHLPRGLDDLFSSGASMDAEVLWMSGGLAILALGLFVTRSLRSF
jgi:hypothetical protein